MVCSSHGKGCVQEIVTDHLLMVLQITFILRHVVTYIGFTALVGVSVLNYFSNSPLTGLITGM